MVLISLLCCLFRISLMLIENIFVIVCLFTGSHPVFSALQQLGQASVSCNQRIVVVTCSLNF